MKVHWLTGRSTLAKLAGSGLVVLLGYLSSVGVQAADWPQFLGPGRDSISRETGLLTTWPVTGPPLVWHRPVLKLDHANDRIAVLETPFLVGQHRHGQPPPLLGFKLDVSRQQAFQPAGRARVRRGDQRPEQFRFLLAAATAKQYSPHRKIRLL